MANKGLNDIKETDLDALFKNINGLIELANGEKVERSESTQEKSEAETEQVDLEKLFENDLYDPQINEIKQGIDKGLDAWIYAKPCYNWMQMREIRLGLMAQIDVKPFLNPLFSAEQMHQIRLGVLAGIEYDKYSSLIHSATDMLHIRRSLLSDEYATHKRLKEQRNVDGDTGIEVFIPDDHMTAYVKLPRYGAEKLTTSDIIRVMKFYDVDCGIKEAVIKQIVKEKCYNKKVKVAEGQKSIQGKDGYYELFFEPNTPGVPKILADGRVDYANTMVAETASPGQKLAVYHPSQKGADGQTVTGVLIKGSNGVELPELRGQGISYNEKKATYTSMIKGYVEYEEAQGLLNVFQIYTINTDVTRYSGKIVFDGTIHVFGNVNDMSYIQASGDVIIDGFIGAAVIKAGNSIYLKHGVNASGGGSIEAGCKIIGEFFEMANLRARDFIEGNYFLNCNISTDSKLIVKGSKARILGGNVSAVLAVESAYIANAGKIQACIKVGDIEDIEQNINKAQRQICKIEDDLQQLEEGKGKLVALYGEELTAESEVYQKTLTTIEGLNQKKVSLEDDIQYYIKLKIRACNAYVKITRELAPYVFVSINGKKTTTDRFIRSMILTKDNIKNGDKRETNG